jgi:integrase
MPKTTLNDRSLKAAKPAPKGKTYDKMDTLVPGFGVRVSDKGRKTFILVARYPGSSNPTRRALGEYGALTLEKARERARDWIEMLRRGVDPREDKERQQLAEQRNREYSFRAVAEEFIRLAVIGPDPDKPKQRKGREMRREIENEFISRWGSRPVNDITARDVVAVLDEAVARGAPYQAHNLLGHIRRLFNWAMGRHIYGLDKSPCDRMKSKDVIGPKLSRTRVLSDAELRALWVATEQLGYPYGPLCRMLALTGQRKSEVAEARWSEFNLDRKLWTIPAERMKGKNEVARPHDVPLTDDVVAILNALPRFKSGDHLFSASFGVKPINNFVKAKANLDRAMLAELGNLDPFVIHDIRRTMRTGLSALSRPDVAELVIAHALPGMRGVYDKYSFEAEKRQALELWAARLRDIVQPPPANVVKLQAARV